MIYSYFSVKSFIVVCRLVEASLWPRCVHTTTSLASSFRFLVYIKSPNTCNMHAQLSSGARGLIVGLVTHLSFFSLHALSEFRGKKVFTNS